MTENIDYKLKGLDMDNTLIEFYDENRHPQLIDFIEAIVDRELLFRASSLENIFKNTDEIYRAVGRAISIYCNNGLSIQHNFKTIYISDDDKKYIIKDWMLSKQAFYPTILNGDPGNLNVGRVQLELLNRLF